MNPGSGSRGSVSAWLGALAGSVALLLAFAFGASAIPGAPIVRFVLGFACLVACVLGVVRATPAVGRRAAALAIAPVAILVVVGVAGSSPTSGAAAAAVLVSILAAGTWVGAFLGGEIESPGHLLPVAYASAVADVCSVLAPSGPTARIVAHHPEVLAVVALPWSFGDGRFEPVLGVGDVLMAALYVAACRAHGLSVARAVAALAAAFAALLAALLVTERPLPALPLLGLAIVLAYPEARRIPARDRVKAIAAMVGVTVGAAIVLYRGTGPTP